MVRTRSALSLPGPGCDPWSVKWNPESHTVWPKKKKKTRHTLSPRTRNLNLRCTWAFTRWCIGTDIYCSRIWGYSKSPTYEPSSCELSKTQLGNHVSNHASSHVWRTLSRACILSKWLCLCVLHCTVLYRVPSLTIFISSSEPLPSTGVTLQLALHLPLLMILQLYHLPPLGSNASCLFTRCQCLHVSCCTVLLYFSRYCAVRLKMFFLLLCLSLCILCVKSIINLFQHSTV